MKNIVEMVGPSVAVVMFCAWFGFNEYFKNDGLTFRQGVRRLFHRDGTHHTA
jgi:hypothetical protein